MAKPRIAVVRGMCIGGGWEVANYCDMVLAREDARFAQAEIQLALVGGPNAAIMVRQIPRRKTAKIILSGGWVDAHEAERLGLVSKVLPANTFDDEVNKFFEKFTSKSSVALKLGRYCLYRSHDVYLTQAYDYVGDIYEGLLMHTEDALEGITAFQEKRKPVCKDK